MLFWRFIYYFSTEERAEERVEDSVMRKIKLYVTEHFANDPRHGIKYWMGCCSKNHKRNTFDIYINSRRNFLFQIITLFHELGHWFNDVLASNWRIKGKLETMLQRLTIPIYYSEVRKGIFLKK